jgi:hypothetical protein
MCMGADVGVDVYGLELECVGWTGEGAGVVLASVPGGLE